MNGYSRQAMALSRSDTTGRRSPLIESVGDDDIADDKMTLRELSEYLQSLPDSLMDMPGTLVVHCDDGDISPKKAEPLNEVEGAETDTMRQVPTAEDVYWKYVAIAGQEACDDAVIAYLQTDTLVELVLENSTPECVEEFLNDNLVQLNDEIATYQDRVDWLHEGP
jgi:hypothetical protein